MNNCIEVSGLQKHYGDIRAVNGLSFSVRAGEVFGLLGPNGAGKTTTTEILVGLRQRDAGEVSVLGLDPAREADELKKRIGVQLQTSSLFPRLTCREIVRLFTSFYPRALPVEEVLDLVQLTEKATVQVKNLSGGQRQRLAVALAMANDGDVIFLDEPTTGLDPQARRSLWQVILNMKSHGKTVFLTTHYMEEAERLCDRVAIIDHGKIIALDSPEALINTHFQEQAVELVHPELAAEHRLEELPGVSRVEGDSERTVLYSTDVSQTVSGLLELASNTGNSSLDNIVIRRATLEDVFLELTGRRIRE